MAHPPRIHPTLERHRARIRAARVQQYAAALVCAASTLTVIRPASQFLARTLRGRSLALLVPRQRPAPDPGPAPGVVEFLTTLPADVWLIAGCLLVSVGALVLAQRGSASVRDLRATYDRARHEADVAELAEALRAARREHAGPARLR